MQENDKSQKAIYYASLGQKKALEKEVQDILNDLEKLFEKDEIMKFLFNFIEEEIAQKENMSPEEIESLEKKIVSLFEELPKDVFEKYHMRIKNVLKKQVFPSLYERAKQEGEIREREYIIKEETEDYEEQKKKYEETDKLKPLMDNTLSYAIEYGNEINKKNLEIKENLDNFYKGTNELVFSNNINGEEKHCPDNDIIKRVVSNKENQGLKYIEDMINYINNSINENSKIKKEINGYTKEIKDNMEKDKTCAKYCNGGKNGVFKNINESEYNI